MDISSFLESSDRVRVFDHTGAVVTSTGGIAAKSHKPLVILDSSYNPPTKAHEFLADFGRSNYNGHMMFMLSVLNADKPVDSAANLQHRANMISMLLKRGDMACFIKAPRFVDKLEILQSDFGSSQYEGLPVFIMGSDTLIRVIDPKYYDDAEKVLNWFFSNCKVANIDRPGHVWPVAIKKPSNNIDYFSTEKVPALSSTLARTQVKETGTTDSVSDDILAYITEHKLYISKQTS